MSDYEYITKHSSPRTAHKPAKRGRGSIKEWTIHQWDDEARKPTFEGTINWLTRPGAVTSAHYVVEAGRVACLVNPRDIAYGNGNWASNLESIVIECHPRASADDYETVAQLVAELEAVYGRLRGGEHRQHKATACPGKWSAAKVAALARDGVPVKSTAYYTIKAGDTLGKIAARFKTTVAKLAKVNGIRNPDKISAGQKIRTK